MSRNFLHTGIAITHTELMDNSPIHPATQKRAQAKRDLMLAIAEYGNSRAFRALGECSQEAVERSRDAVKQRIIFLIDAAQQEAIAE